MILSEQKIALARAKGICFLCVMCKHWHDGEEQGLVDDLGETICSKNDCLGPVWGGSFDKYEGPLGEYRHNFCYLCGAKSTHMVWANGMENKKIGLCLEHVSTIKKYTSRKVKSGYSLIVAGHLAGPDKFEVEQ